ncbi:phosphoribosylformylglycinamidine synthase subunit PurQ [Schlesneria paludicola]|uniref:phosphoribosylformylglycinamidine synthase subunit PurQ n=1 Tax=Schlesneria paludicola TaxID=360056 RepID=UPI0004928E30|nr:phosphoribosylformylglycinamidine synthase subunit PurQ [Schlesneria paludicola]
MAAPRVCVLRAPGTNCDLETAFAFNSCGGVADAVHLYRLIERPAMLDDYQILCIPGGFSYGDDIGAGVVFSSQLRSQLGDVVQQFLTADKLVLGICNGFQTLLKAGVLPYGADGWGKSDRSEADATLTWNHNGKYTARWVHLKVAGSNNVFLRDIDELDLPIAHAEGRLVTRSESIVDKWRSQRQIALQYAPWARGSDGASHPLNDRWDANPNGAVADIAGLSDPSGRVLGLMPHPERFLFATQHPHWTRLRLEGAGAGYKLFQNGVNYFE